VTNAVLPLRFWAGVMEWEEAGENRARYRPWSHVRISDKTGGGKERK